jgi:uncharacterized protein with PIN domain
MTQKTNSEKLVRCDTCGMLVVSVSRVVIDEGYDRSMSKAIYNCPECFAKKEQKRNKSSSNSESR